MGARTCLWRAPTIVAIGFCLVVCILPTPVSAEEHLASCRASNNPLAVQGYNPTRCEAKFVVTEDEDVSLSMELRTTFTGESVATLCQVDGDGSCKPGTLVELRAYFVDSRPVVGDAQPARVSLQAGTDRKST